MNFIEFVFTVLKKFVKIDERKFIRLQNDGLEWYAKLQEEKNPNALQRYLIAYGEKWYVQTALAVGYIFAIKWVADFINPASEYDPDEENYI